MTMELLNELYENELYIYWKMQRHWHETRLDYDDYMHYEFELKDFLEWIAQ